MLRRLEREDVQMIREDLEEECPDGAADLPTFVRILLRYVKSPERGPNEPPTTESKYATPFRPGRVNFRRRWALFYPLVLPV